MGKPDFQLSSMRSGTQHQRPNFTKWILKALRTPGGQGKEGSQGSIVFQFGWCGCDGGGAFGGMNNLAENNQTTHQRFLKVPWLPDSTSLVQCVVKHVCNMNTCDPLTLYFWPSTHTHESAHM